MSAGRADVLAYTSAPLPEEMAITGPTHVVLFVSSDAPDTDFVAKLVDVFPNGTRLLLQDGVQRMRWREPRRGPQAMAPGALYEIAVDLGSTSYVFAPGHRVGLDVSSSSFPQFDANPNTGAPLARPSRDPPFRIANNTVHMGPGAPSRVVLPVVPVAAVAPLGYDLAERLRSVAERARAAAQEWR